MLVRLIQPPAFTTTSGCTALISIVFKSASPWDHVRWIPCEPSLRLQSHYARALKLFSKYIIECVAPDCTKFDTTLHSSVKYLPSVKQIRRMVLEICKHSDTQIPCQTIHALSLQSYLLHQFPAKSTILPAETIKFCSLTATGTRQSSRENDCVQKKNNSLNMWPPIVSFPFPGDKELLNSSWSAVTLMILQRCPLGRCLSFTAACSQAYTAHRHTQHTLAGQVKQK